MSGSGDRELVPTDPDGYAAPPRAPSGGSRLLALLAVAGVSGLVSIGAVHSAVVSFRGATPTDLFDAAVRAAAKPAMSSLIQSSQWAANVDAAKLKRKLVKQAVKREMERGKGNPICGVEGSNGGSLMQSRPVVANTTCGCAAICANTPGCAGWTYAPSLGTVSNGEALAACFLRSSWGAMRDVSLAAVRSSATVSATSAEVAVDSAVGMGADVAQIGAYAANNCVGACWSAPVDNCGFPWNFAAAQQSQVPASSACECAALCEKSDECDAYTYMYDYASDKPCWLMAEAGEGSAGKSCYDECYAGQSLKAKCGVPFEGFYYLGATTMNTASGVSTPCACEKLCLDTTGCKAWSYIVSSMTGSLSSVSSNTCRLFSSVTARKSCTDCVSNTVKGAAKAFNELEYANAEVRDRLRKEEEKNSICGKTAASTGTMASIAGKNFAGVQKFPDLESCSYRAVSAYLTAVPSLNGSVTEDVRASYPRIAGTYMPQLYLARLNNYNKMTKAHGKSKCDVGIDQWMDTAAQIGEELEMLVAMAGWFDVFSFGFDELSSMVFDAFTTTAALVDMPATTQVAHNKVNWWKVSLDILSACASIGALIATDGGSAAAKHALKGAKKAGKDAEEAEKAASAAKDAYETLDLISSNLDAFTSLTGDALDINGQIKAGSSSAAQPTDDSDATTADYYVFTDSVVKELGSILTMILSTQPEIATNYGRMKAASSLAGGCPISNGLMSKVISESYGALQWLALGQLLPTKYAIFWQRDYMGTQGPGCYYNNCGGGSDSDECGTSDGYVLGCEGSQRGCWEPDVMKWDATVTKDGFLKNPFDCDEWGQEGVALCATWDYESVCADAKREVWVGQLSNPSQTPTDPFWEALAGPDGPIATYINRRFGTTYTGAEGGFAAFVSQCQYMPKVYIPGGSGSIDYSETQVSSAKVDCNVYGIKIPTYAFEDCGTQREGSSVCINGYGIDNDGSKGDGTGNFNTFMWLPNTPGDYANHKSGNGQVGCCLPWTSQGASTPTLPKGCDFALCDCYTLAEASSNGDISSSDGQSQGGDWWGSCKVNTGNPSEKQYVQSSLGQNCPWPLVPLLANNFSGCSASVAQDEDKALHY